MKKFTIAIALFFSVLAVQAQTKATQKPTDEKASDEQESLAKDYLSQIMGVALSATSNMKLFHFVYDWIGTPYRFGGDSKHGIDCSAFTKELYSQVFNLDIQRSSRDIFSMVSPVRRDDPQEGQPLFLKKPRRPLTQLGINPRHNPFRKAPFRGGSYQQPRRRLL